MCLQQPHPFSSIREDTKVFCVARAAKFRTLPPLPVDQDTVLAALPGVLSSYTQLPQPFFCAHSTHFRPQYLDAVGSDLVFVGHAVLPPFIGLSVRPSQCGVPLG